jgi:rod shape-determining protein MreD
VRFFYAILTLALWLAVQVIVGRVAPQVLTYADFMLLPVAWYGLRGKPQTAMLVGCAAGLLTDAWFQNGIMGFHGFKKTLLGWGLGTLGARWDLNRRTGQFLAGALLSVADHYLGWGLLHLLGQRADPPDWRIVLIRAGVMALLVCLVFVMFDRAKSRETQGRPKVRQVGRAF